MTCTIFTKFTEFVHHFRMHYMLKYGWICSRGYEVIGVLIWGDGFPPDYQWPSVGKLCHTPKSFWGARTYLRSSITVPDLVGLRLHPLPVRAKTLSFFVSLFMCLSHFWMTEFVHTILPWSCCSIETMLVLLDSGRFVVVHLHITLSDCRQLATPQNAEVQEVAKFGVFRHQRATE